LFLPVLSMLGADLLAFKGTVSAQLGLGKGHVDVPSESPFVELGVAGTARTYHYNDMRFVAHAPRVIRHARVLRQA
jgi:hypothetical protein